MAGLPYTSGSSPQKDENFSGGLNSTSGPLNAKDTESSDLQNIDFNKFGSILKRNGYIPICTSTILASAPIDGLAWYEFVSGSTSGRIALATAGTSIYSMTTLGSTWTHITGATIVTSGNHVSWENFTNKIFMVDGANLPKVWAGTGTCTIATVPTGVTKVKFVTQFNNYLFYGNVAMGATDMTSRVYWSNVKDPTTWDSDQFIEVSKDDGQPITGLKPLGDRLVVYKERAIYNLYFTGDADIPFIMPGGGKSNSTVGCVAPYSIQEIENGHVFLSFDGLYFYDGSNSYKLSDRVTQTLLTDCNPNYFNKSVSCVQKGKNRYFLALSSEGKTTNDTVLVWDWYNNAFSVYKGLNPSSMCTFYVSGLDERPHFGDYNGWVYRMDTGTDDYPSNTATAINAYYYTNWKTYEDLCDQKGVAHVYIYYQLNTSTLSFSYSYDFESTDHYTNTFSTSAGATAIDLFGIGQYGTAVYSGSGGSYVRRDLTGRGRVVRFKFSNSNLGEAFRVDGIGSYVHLETMV
jgi:hypothetical protein